MKEFNLGFFELLQTLKDIKEHNDEFSGHNYYVEHEWRSLGSNFFSNRAARSLVQVQTKPTFTGLAKIIDWASGKDPNSYQDNAIDLSVASIDKAIEAVDKLIEGFEPRKRGIELQHPVEFSSIVYSDRIFKAIATKPFAILTGASGTGKTKLAEALAEHFRNSEEIEEATNSAIVPVGADWTDNRNVLGFVNHLRDEGPPNNRPIYQSTKVLDLLLEANRNAAVPYFLILDEMNLSHVERYFADFLSTMEQKDGKLSLHDEGPREVSDYTLPRFSGDTLGVPRKLSYPKNLFVIGTVNIDETTYMFSPKVLDRANVIEFTIDESAIEEFLKGPGPYPAVEKAANGIAEAFLALALKARNDTEEAGLDALPVSVKEPVNQHILDLFKILKAGRFEFAFRSSNEVLRYLKVCRHLSENKEAWDAGDWKKDLDDQVLQKLLPKLHGSVGRIGKLLAELARYCEQGTAREDEEAEPKLKEVSDFKTEGATFPNSLKKLQSMAATLLDEQFVSFVH
ncbi:McrB family protein [Pelagicoccus albus]|uniref:AAA+ ATPase domain-containing protein n=1 Tax=Pelagicoccus albus TaxID=415222 RepID=A0A7X1B898_9BACT|nr:hypothetical protein [Pelagicoccus albus]MBC2607495.1 hypothetical protein [Pelagicoccus albus]